MRTPCGVVRGSATYFVRTETRTEYHSQTEINYRYAFFVIYRFHFMFTSSNCW